MIVTYFTFLGVFAVLLVISAAKHKKFEEAKQDSKLLTVIIPFRNEEANLPGLIKSIQAQTVLPYEILFIDDHSLDKGKELLETVFLGKTFVSIISLPDSVEGKKGAIDFGATVQGFQGNTSKNDQQSRGFMGGAIKARVFHRGFKEMHRTQSTVLGF